MNALSRWDELYRGREQVFSGNPNPVLVAEASALPPGRALDVGCGEGADARWLARHGWQVTAVDVSPTALARAAAATGTGTTATAATATSTDAATDTTATGIAISTTGTSGTSTTGTSAAAISTTDTTDTATGTTATGTSATTTSDTTSTSADADLTAAAPAVTPPQPARMTPPQPNPPDRVTWLQADLLTTPPDGTFDLVSVHYFPLPRHPDHAVRGLLAAVAPGGTLLFTTHDPAGLSAAPGFAPDDFAQPDDLAALLGDGWTVQVNETRPRPAPTATPHTHDAVLRAQRLRR